MKLACLLLLVALVWGHPSPRKAGKCSPVLCKIEDDCRCSSEVNPFNDKNALPPQLIGLTVSESIVTTLYNNHLKPLLFNRKNPDGRPISASFYVNHEYTDYTLVQDLYLRGFEIGVHSITKNFSQEYWRFASHDLLGQEFFGQRQIISHFANIPIDDVVGARTPQLQIEGDVSIDAYIKSGLQYDNSWTTSSNSLLFPYTLDYASTQSCLATLTCPQETHSHFWIAPITSIRSKNNVECNSLAACAVTGTPEGIAKWLVGEIDRVRNGRRAPLTLRLDSYWFQSNPNSTKGFNLFMDEMSKRNDVFFVSVKDIIDWTKHPVSAEDFATPVYQRQAVCQPKNCLNFLNGYERFMNQCLAKCPPFYPWIGNPLGEEAKKQ